MDAGEKGFIMNDIVTVLQRQGGKNDTRTDSMNSFHILFSKLLHLRCM